MHSIFQHHSSTTQTKNSVSDLIKLQLERYLERDPSFGDEFTDAVNHILVFTKKDARIEVLEKLVAAFIVSFREPIPAQLIEKYKMSQKQQNTFTEYRTTFSTEFTQYLLKCTKATNKCVRHRAVQMISEVMTLLNEESEFRFTFLH